MFHLCDRVDGRSHLSVPLTRSHLYKKADLGTCRDMRPARICFYLPNLPEERHDGFNSWLRLFVGSKLSLVAFQCCWFWLHQRWIFWSRSQSYQLVASTMEKANTLGCFCLRMLTINQPMDNQDIKIINSDAVLCSKPPQTRSICVTHCFYPRRENAFSEICPPKFSFQIFKLPFNVKDV